MTTAILMGGGAALAALGYSAWTPLVSAAAAASALMTFSTWREHHPHTALTWLGHGARTMHQVLADGDREASAPVTPLRESSAG